MNLFALGVAVFAAVLTVQARLDPSLAQLEKKESSKTDGVSLEAKNFKPIEAVKDHLPEMQPSFSPFYFKRSKIFSRLLKDSETHDSLRKRTCGDDWTYNDATSRCYRYATEMRTWSDANRSCNEDGGRLAVIKDAAENDWLADFAASSRRVHCAAWIGLHDATASHQWTWVDGHSTATFFWAKGEPNGLGGAENCVHVYARQTEANDEHAALHAKWNDDHCEETHDYICEKEAISAA